MKICASVPPNVLTGCLNLHHRTDALIELALNEDAGLGDLTSEAIFSPGHVSSAEIIAREDLVVCGIEVASRVFTMVDSAIAVTACAQDGDSLSDRQAVMRMTGPTIGLLIAERTALNFLQRLSGIATLSSQYAGVAGNSGQTVRIVDTRKTTPGWRDLEKHAVRCGGCFNHRSSLSEHVLIKDNHIAAAGSIQSAIERVRHAAPHCAKIEVEAVSISEVKQALAARAEIIMLDNMTPGQIAEAVEVINGAALVEVSGGVNLDTIANYILPGVDVISVGALTHAAQSRDLSMNMSATENSD
jgi:nicotinate-nucleotide pyrophosphorylase (carboxylating)